MTLLPDGTLPNLWASGILVYAGVVLVANYQLLLAYNNYTLFGVVLSLLSILLFFFVFFLESMHQLKFHQMMGLYSHVMNNPLSYFALLFLIVFIYGLEKIFGLVGQILDKRQRQRDLVENVTFEPMYNHLQDEKE